MAGFGGTVKLTGESEYKKALADITGNLKVLNSEMKVVTSQYDRNDKSTENLSQQNEVLNKKIAEQKEKVELLKSALADAEQETGKNSSTSQKWQTELNNAQAELNKLVKNVNDNEKAMEQSADATDENADSVKDFGKNADDSGKKALSMGDIIKANLISDAIKAGLQGLANGIKSVGSAMSESLTAGAEYADNILTMSTVTGVSTDNLQKYNAVAELVDVSTETMTKSMAKNIKSMTSAQEGTGAMADAYAKLGVSVTDAEGNLRDGETVYWETIDALKNVTDETERDSLAMELLGKSAQELNPLIAQGSEGIKAMGDEAVKMGTVLSEDALQSLGAVDDEMQRFSSITSATSNLFASAFAPAISTLMGGVNDLGGSFNYLISSIIGGDEGGIAEASTMISENVTAMVESITAMAPQLLEIAGSLISTLVSVISENLPTLVESGLSMLVSLLSGIGENLAQILPTVMSVIQTLITTILQNLPQILDMGIKMLTSLIQGIANSLPKIIPVAIKSVMQMVETLLDNIDLIIDAGIELILALADGLLNALPDLIDKIPVIIDKLINAITNNLPKIIEMGIELTLKLAVGLIKAIPQLIAKIPQIITSLVNGLKNGLSKMADVGLNLVQGLWNGISDATSWVIDKIKGFGESILNGIKDFFGIASPSKETAKLGKFMGEGIGVGFVASEKDMLKSINKECKVVQDTLLKSVKNGKFEEAGEKAIDNFSTAIEKKEKSVINAVTKTVNTAISKMTEANESQKSQYEKLGKNIIESFTSGIEKETDKAVNSLNTTISKLTKNAQDKLNEVQASQNNLQSKIFDYGDLFTVNKETGEVTLGNLKKQNKEMKEYAKDLELLQGLVSDGLIEEITSLDAETGSAVAEKLLSMTDKELAEFDKAYKQKVKLSKSLSKSVYADEVAEINKEFTTNVNKEMQKLAKKMQTIGQDAVKGFTKGLKSKNKDLESSLKSFSDSIIKQIKKEFKINSPSKLMEDEIGSNLALGVGKGFVDTMANVSADIQNAIPTEFDTSISAKGGTSAGYSQYDMMVGAFKQALKEVKVVMNNREMGAFVTNTMERVVYS